MSMSSGNLPSVMKHNFSQVPKAEIQRSQFDRSHGFKTTFNSGYLVPVFVDEVLPGDTFNLKMTTFARLSTPIVPFMDNLYCDSFFFFVPHRLVWDNWEKFNGEQDNPGDSTDFLVPTLTAPAMTGVQVGEIGDFFGIPTGVPGLVFDSLPFRAYNLIWNDWFRDQNLQDSLTVETDDGPDTYADYVLQRRGKRHDYFTSCLPWPQKGPAVPLPLGSSAPVKGIGIEGGGAAGALGGIHETGGPPTVGYTGWQVVTPGGVASSTPVYVNEDSANSGYPLIYADLSAATASTVNALRQSFQIQRLYERDARGGTRYTEIIRSHFGVVSPDMRLQRPEYLGGGSTPIKINPIAQTGGTGASGTTTPQGNLAAMGTFSHGGNGFVKSFTEHGTIIGLISVRADLNYQQGLNRMWSRQTRFDFYWPALSHIGEQAVLNQEIFAVGSADPSQDAGVFGYQERYAEYRYKPSLITGQYRSSFSTPLDYWHLAQNFTSLPTLGATFIADTPPIQRVVAVENPYPEFLLDAYFQLKCARPMPTYSVPGLIDHF